MVSKLVLNCVNISLDSVILGCISNVLVRCVAFDSGDWNFT
jgi:hypothetical protein